MVHSVDGEEPFISKARLGFDATGDPVLTPSFRRILEENESIDASKGYLSADFKIPILNHGQWPEQKPYLSSRFKIIVQIRSGISSFRCSDG